MKPDRLDPIIKLLTLLVVFLVGCLFAQEVFFKDDSQFFQVVSGMATGVLGALLGIITGRRIVHDPATGGTPSTGGGDPAVGVPVITPPITK